MRPASGAVKTSKRISLFKRVDLSRRPVPGTLIYVVLATDCGFHVKNADIVPHSSLTPVGGVVWERRTGLQDSFDHVSRPVDSTDDRNTRVGRLRRRLIPELARLVHGHVVPNH